MRNKDEADEQSQSRDCQGLCFFNVEDDIDDKLKTCSIIKNRSKRDISKPIARLSNGSTAYPGSLPYVVRLIFQKFDQFHSDSQACFHLNSYFKKCITYAAQGESFFKQYNLCAGTVIEKHWILTSATCCKRDDIVTIKFNDYSGLFQIYK